MELLNQTYGLAAIEQHLPAIWNVLKQYKVAALVGEMGAGKTTLINALCKYLGVQEATNSPTFSIVQEYKTTANATIFHLDLYRINDFEELLDTGIEEVIEDGKFLIMLMEWPQIATPILPQAQTVVLQLSKINADQRQLVITPMPR